MQLARANASANVDVAAHRAALNDADVVGALHVAAHALDAHRALQVGDVHVAGDALDPCRPARAVQVKVAADRLRVDRRFTRDSDLEIDTKALAPEEIEPGALLLVEVGLDEDVVALLFDADLDVLEQPLGAIGAPALDALPRDDAYLAGLADADRRFAGDVLDAETRHSLHREGLLHGLVMTLAGLIVHADERGAHRARDLVRIHVHVDVEASVPETELVPCLMARTPLLTTVLALSLAVDPLPLPVVLALLAVPLPLLGVAAVLVIYRIERHVTGSFSRSCAASSGAIRPSASSRRISLRRSASRSGSACEGKPSARITASSRERTVG